MKDQFKLFSARMHNHGFIVDVDEDSSMLRVEVYNDLMDLPHAFERRVVVFDATEIDTAEEWLIAEKLCVDRLK